MLINTKYQNDWIKLQTVPLNDQDYWHSLVWRETSSSFPVSSLTLGKKTMISIFISVRVVFNLTFAKNSWCIAADSSLVSLMWSDNCLETWASIWSIISNSQVYSIWCYKYIFDWFFLFFLGCDQSPLCPVTSHRPEYGEWRKWPGEDLPGLQGEVSFAYSTIFSVGERGGGWGVPAI